MLFVHENDAAVNFIHGFGNGGTRKKQGEGATFTAVPITFNGHIAGSFNILSSAAQSGMLSKVATKKMQAIDLKPNLQIVYKSKIGSKINSVF